MDKNTHLLTKNCEHRAGRTCEWCAGNHQPSEVRLGDGVKVDVKRERRGTFRRNQTRND